MSRHQPIDLTITKKYLVSFDVNSKSTGYCIFSNLGNGYTMEGFEVVLSKNPYDSINYSISVVNEVSEKLSCYDEITICIEEILKFCSNSHANTILKLASLSSMIQLNCFLNFHTVPNMVHFRRARSKFGLNGKGKEGCVSFFMQNCSNPSQKEKFSFMRLKHQTDIADAFIIGKYYITEVLHEVLLENRIS